MIKLYPDITTMKHGGEGESKFGSKSFIVCLFISYHKRTKTQELTCVF